MSQQRPDAWVVGDNNGGHVVWSQREADEGRAGGWSVIPMRAMRDDEVAIPRAELVALYGDAPVDVPVIRRVLGETK